MKKRLKIKGSKDTESVSYTHLDVYKRQPTTNKNNMAE